MASEVRVNQIQNRSGLGTVTFGDSGVTVAGITTFLGNVNVSSGSSITVGDTFIKRGAVGLGTTTTAGRNAGVGTATGTLIYNSTNDTVECYFGNVFGWIPVKTAFSATGGTLLQDDLYKYHVFTAPGDFVVSAGSKNIEFLLVAGGAGMIGNYGSGGGAGGISHAQNWPVVVATYPVVVGPGGSPNPSMSALAATTAHGSDSTFNGVTSVGGGIGMHDAFEGPQPYSPQINGGCGGGTGDDSSGGAGTGTQPAQPTHGGLVTNYGFPGFKPESGNTSGGNNKNSGGGGAGAGGAPAGTPGPTVTNTSRPGGSGQPFPGFPAPLLAPAIPAPVRPSWTPAVGPTGLFGGGGGGAGNTPGPYAGGPGGGGAGTSSAGASATSAVNFTGGGGGAVYTGGTAGSGGTGIFIIKYIA